MNTKDKRLLSISSPEVVNVQVNSEGIAIVGKSGCLFFPLYTLLHEKQNTHTTNHFFHKTISIFHPEGFHYISHNPASPEKSQETPAEGKKAAMGV